jgi:chemotaxis signal transduction protein
MSQDPQDARQFVVFTINDVACGIPIDTVIEIMQVPEITRSVGANASVPGLFDFRGQVVMVVDCRLALSFPAEAVTERSRVIVVNHVGQPVGLLVDAVTEVATIEGAKRQATQGAIGASPIVTAVAHLEEGLMLEVDWSAALEMALNGGVRELPSHLLPKVDAA